MLLSCRTLRLMSLLIAISSLIYGLSTLLPIDLCAAIFCLKINTLIALVFLSLSLVNNSTPHKNLLNMFDLEMPHSYMFYGDDVQVLETCICQHDAATSSLAPPCFNTEVTVMTCV